ncbi:MAG: sigma-70 family RNA polymerase sigma factor [bacterium]|nr:sigma-70 family RNA polymerase sigma factor [bacterium]
MPARSPAIERAGSREDDDLMRAIAAGDQAAAKQVVEHHLPLLMPLARYMLGSDAEAEEIAQESFLKLWKQAKNWQPERALIATWLRRVASNLCIDRLRQRHTTAHDLQDDLSVAPTQQRDLEEKHLTQRVGQALLQLPERQKLALTLCHYQGMSQKEAAEVMEISEHALESLLSRARRGLKKSLEHEWKQLLPDRHGIGEFGDADLLHRVKK